MTNNDILIRLRYALNITDLKVKELFTLADYEIAPEELAGIFLREDEAGHLPCTDRVAGLFLKGLIASRRGKRDEPSPAPRGPLTNNEVLRRVRIALELKDEDIMAIMKLAEVEVSKAEVNALFRKKGHDNYRDCGDQFLRNFLLGLTKKYRA
ncbi:MAG: DUF1456 family protein [Spirochaetaceae bacterium]|nr:DUF1456 family protein [Spirochaetaceae bacterium]